MNVADFGGLMKFQSLSMVVLVSVALTALTGAKGNGCGAEYQPGDGSSASWAVGTVPTAKGADLPMSCEWLESNNCWKQMVDDVTSCAPKDVGAFNADRSACEFDQQATMDFAGPLSTPAPGNTLIEIVDHRFTDVNNAPCFTGKILGIGRTAFAGRKGTVVSENKTTLNYRIICPDGSSYANDIAGTCADFGVRYVQSKVPTYIFKCEGSGTCSSVAGGGSSNTAKVLASCK
jgi:hypothetical protein